ncbi:MAG: OmpA family protein [Pseudomonadota bacterium]
MTIRRITGACTVAAFLLTTACAQVPPADPGQPNARQNQGAVWGAVLGGLFGAAVDDDNRARGAIIGATGGGLLGAGVGAYLDRQAADLQAALASDEIIITNTGEELRVVMPEGILFAVDSAAVRADLQADLRALARNVITYRETTIEVVGHTDSTGSDAYNLDLSTRRAAAVAGILLEEGVDPARVTSTGQGEFQPVATNDTAEGRQQNRRVEVIIRPIVAG